MNDFRSRLNSIDEPAGHLFKAKNSRDKRAAPAAEDENLREVVIPREEVRAADHRYEDRHRLAREAAIAIRHKRKRHEVALINLSGGGAMIETAAPLRIWDKIVLELAGKDPSGKVECAVRWIKGGRVGVEFAHETHIDADRASCDALLRDVLDKSFADVVADPAPPPSEILELVDEDAAPPGLVIAAELPDRDEARRDELRHPLIWHGQVLFQHESHTVRLRNISANGALIESAKIFPLDAEIMLDLGDAGHQFARVGWNHGDQFGLAFAAPFDIARLSASKPQVACDVYERPGYLEADAGGSSPWAAQWGRMSVPELRKSLGR